MFSIMIPMLIGTAQEAYAGESIGVEVGVNAEYITPDTTELLLVVVQTNLAWVIPVALSAVGIGIFVARRKHA